MRSKSQHIGQFEKDTQKNSLFPAYFWTTQISPGHILSISFELSTPWSSSKSCRSQVDISVPSKWVRRR